LGPFVHLIFVIGVLIVLSIVLVFVTPVSVIPVVLDILFAALISK
jgi:hypothetical protein